MKDYKIKVDGEKHQFEGGAIRYNKNKGRMDLIPAGPLRVLLNYIQTDYDCNAYLVDSRVDMESYLRVMCLQALDSIMLSENTAEQNKALAETICSLMILNRAIVQHRGSFPVYAHTLIELDVPELLLELSVHFQKGAEKYGEHNCEKGIPLWSFIDSGKRHAVQFIKHTDDGENHYIAAVWNFWMAIWTNLQIASEHVLDDEAAKIEVNHNTDRGNKLSGDNHLRIAHSDYVGETIISKAGPILLHWIYEYFDIDTKEIDKHQFGMLQYILGKVWENSGIVDFDKNLCPKDYLMIIVNDPEHQVERVVQQYGLSKKKKRK